MRKKGTKQQNKTLNIAFKRYQERYFGNGIKPDLTKLLPEVLYRTMRLEGEDISRKEAEAIFK
jgi:hypothetical protein